MNHRFENELIQTDNLRLNCSVTGRDHAPWITLAHSLATDKKMWELQLPALNDHFQVLSFDARGHGKSDVPNGPSSMSDLLQDVLGLWDHFNIARSHFVGLSMGGMTGVGLALKYPDRLLSLAACDCRLDSPEFFKNMWDQRIETVRKQGMQGVVDATIGTWFTQQRLLAGGELIDRIRNMITSTNPSGYISCAQALKHLSYKVSLSDLRVPTLYLVGEHDGPHPVEMESLAALSPGAQFSTIADAAHLSNLEQPQRFNAELMCFLKD